MPATTAKYLGIYLNDHLAAVTGLVELAKRAAGEYDATELGAFLVGLRDGLEGDRAVLEQLMDDAGVGQDRAKTALAWAGEKAGRLKLNGELTGSSPLSPVVELEGLSTGLAHLQLLWTGLEEAHGISLPPERLSALTARVGQRREELEEHRRAALRTALA
jgi:hypothetical protein